MPSTSSSAAGGSGMTKGSGSSGEDDGGSSTSSGSNSSPSPSSVDKPKVCKSRWRGRTCNVEDCSRAHPNYCTSKACKPKRDPACNDWHTIRQGNGKGGTGAAAAVSSSLKSGGRKDHHPRQQQQAQRHRGGRQQPQQQQQSRHQLEQLNLRLRLARAQLESAKAKEKLSKLSNNPRSYAAVTAGNPSLALPVTKPTSPKRAMGAETTTPVEPSLDAVVPLLMSLMSALQVRST